MFEIIIKQGDITEMNVDAIVNAANTSLMLGSGVAGAVRIKGGSEIQKECNNIGPIALGEAAVTGGGNLKSKYVIHAAGMRLGSGVTGESLRNTTKNSLKRACEFNLKTVAFPAIGTGVGGFSVRRCAEIMLEELVEFFNKTDTILEKVYFVLFDKNTYDEFKKVFNDKKISFRTDENNQENKI